MQITKFTAIFLIFIGCNHATSQDSQKITDFDTAKNPNAVLVDVRTPEEFAAGHLPKAKNINVYDENFVARFAKFNKKETIYVYCRSGARSAKAQHKLRELGYTKVINLQGGFLAWQAAGKDVEGQ